MANLQLVVITGLSGAGRTTALRQLEDLGYFCVDNIPPALIANLTSLLDEPEGPTRVGLGIDVRTGRFLEGATAALDRLHEGGYEVELIFLEA